MVGEIGVGEFAERIFVCAEILEIKSAVYDAIIFLNIR
jgi:hypothetical protein